MLAPEFLVVRDLGLYNSFAGIILPAVLTATGCFMFRQFFLTVPDELVEAARIDGARELSIFLRIMVPISRPIMLTLAILSFQWRWNDYIWPLLVLNDPNKFTVQIGIQSIVGAQNINWSVLLGASVISMIPLIAVLPGVPAVRHERQHQRRTEGLTVPPRSTTSSSARWPVRPTGRPPRRTAGPDRTDGVPHRELMRRVKTLVAAYRSPDSALYGSGRAVAAAATALLRAGCRRCRRPPASSPAATTCSRRPDSAFTVNDVCDAHVLAGRRRGPTLREVAAALAEIAGARLRRC